MANPYAQFKKPEDTPAPQAPAPAAPEAAAPPAENPYQAVAAEPAAPPKPEPMSMEDFADALYKRLNDPKGGSKEDVLAWAASVGHPLAPGKNFDENFRRGEGNRKKPGSGGPYGRVIPPEDGNYLSADSVGAFERGLGDAMTLNTGDNIVAGLKSLLGFGTYDENMANQNQQRNVDEVVNPGARKAGGWTGVAGTAVIPIGGLKAGAGLLENSLRSGGIGATMGLINGTASEGDGRPLTAADRIGNGLNEAETGGIFGALAPGAGKLAGTLARPVVDAIATRMGGESGAINALGRRLTGDPAEMAAEAKRLRDAGIEPTPYDVLGQTGQDVVGSLARRQTPARDAMQRFGDSTRVGFPDRVRTQARRLSTEARTPDEIVSELNKNRDANFANGFNPIRGESIPVPDDLAAILQTGEGRTALRQAAETVVDPEAKRALLNVTAAKKLTPEEQQIVAMHAQVDAMGLPAEAAAAAKAQLPPLPEQAAPTITLDALDKVRRSLRDAAGFNIRQGRPARARVLSDYANQVRDTGTAAHPGYGELLTKYGDETDLGNAVRTGEGFLDRNTDEFVRKAAGLSDVKVTGPTKLPAPKTKLSNVESYDHPSGDRYINAEYTAPDGEPIRLMFKLRDGKATGLTVGNKGEGMGGPGDQGAWEDVANTLGPAGVRDMMASVQAEFPEITSIAGKRATGASAGTPAAETVVSTRRPDVSERDLARAGARRAVERKAGEGTAGAYSTAESLAYAPEQGKRTAALIGDEAAKDLASAMQAELKVARNRIRNAPNSGSATAMRTADDNALESLGHILANPTSKLSYARAAISSISKYGVSNRAAERIVNFALDPANTDRAIEMLAKRMKVTRDRASYLVRLIRTGGATQEPNSKLPQPQE